MLLQLHAIPAAPVPVTSLGARDLGQQITAGGAAFDKAGCNVCQLKVDDDRHHLNTALTIKTVFLFSDLPAYYVDTGGPHFPGRRRTDESRTAPLWGVGQRLFFLHDGRTFGHRGRPSRRTVSFFLFIKRGDTPVINNFNGVEHWAQMLPSTYLELESQNPWVLPALAIERG